MKNWQILVIGQGPDKGGSKTVGKKASPYTFVKMYALNGKTKYVEQSKVAANQKVGWYLYWDYIYAIL